MSLEDGCSDCKAHSGIITLLNDLPELWKNLGKKINTAMVLWIFAAVFGILSVLFTMNIKQHSAVIKRLDVQTEQMHEVDMAVRIQAVKMENMEMAFERMQEDIDLMADNE